MQLPAVPKKKLTCQQKPEALRTGCAPKE